ncbi:MBL fold metallo-hydrolase [Cohnella sp.]|uniref:MBL fold metallo-hydrolase n=1 Tax=Cohnella sp. TaxID=1883426 RepID=UPI00356A3427
MSKADLTERPEADKPLIREIEDTKVPYGVLAVWSLGQASFIVKGGSTVVYVDPFALSDEEVERRYGLKRQYPSPMRPEQIVNADCCLITHEHSDHLDPDTIRAMAAANPKTLFVAPNCCLEEMRQCGVSEERLFRAETDKAVVEDGGFFVKPIPAAHEQLEQDSEGLFKHVGYVVRLNGVTWYHAGDTVIYDGLAERVAAERIDLALLPINGRDAFRTERGIIGNMDYREAAELAHRAGFGMTVPMHYDLFAGNSERPGYFVDHVYHNFPRLRTHVMARGERFVFVSDAVL